MREELPEDTSTPGMVIDMNDIEAAPPFRHICPQCGRAVKVLWITEPMVAKCAQCDQEQTAKPKRKHNAKTATK